MGRGSAGDGIGPGTNPPILSLVTASHMPFRLYRCIEPC